MDFKKELAKHGYNKGNSIDVEILVEEILPNLLIKNKKEKNIKNIILTSLWDFCEKEFNADFENDYINGVGVKKGLSDRTEKFTENLCKKIVK